MTAILDRPRVYLPALHPAQREVLDQAVRFSVVACGRRWGKTTLGLDRVIVTAASGQPAAWFAPTYKLLTEVWRELAERLRPLVRRSSSQEHRLDLMTGGVVECWSLDGGDAARGRKYARVILDEAAMVPNLEDVWHQAIRPTLTDFAGDAWFLSTPRGLNAFHALYQRGQDPLQPEWRSWQMPTSRNPHLPASEIAAAEHDLPERAFAQEYLAAFLADGTGVFRRVQEAAVLRPRPREDGHVYVAGVDWGRHNDFTVISVLDATTREQVALDRFSQTEYAVQLDRLRAMHDRYRLQAIVAETNNMGDPLVEILWAQRLPVHPWTATQTSKATVIQALALALEQGEVRLVDDAVQTAELLAYDSERLPSGMLRYGAPAGLHDDCVMALALAWQGALAPRDRPKSVPYAIGAGARVREAAWDPFEGLN